MHCRVRAIVFLYRYKIFILLSYLLYFSRHSCLPLFTTIHILYLIFVHINSSSVGIFHYNVYLFYSSFLCLLSFSQVKLSQCAREEENVKILTRRTRFFNYFECSSSCDFRARSLMLLYAFLFYFCFFTFLLFLFSLPLFRYTRCFT